MNLFKEEFEKIIYANKTKEEVVFELKKYLENNKDVINNDELINVLTDRSQKNADLFMKILVTSIDIPNFLWDLAKYKKNNMVELFEASIIFNNRLRNNQDGYILNEVLDLDINVLLKVSQNGMNQLSEFINYGKSIEFLVNKKDKINNASEKFKKGFISVLSNGGLYFAEEKMKLDSLKIILNVNNWFDIDPFALKEILSLAATIQNKKQKNDFFNEFKKSCDKIFFKGAEKNKISITALLFDTECIPTINFIKTCAKHEPVNLNNWIPFIKMSDLLFNKKIESSKKSNELSLFLETIEPDFLNKVLNFQEIRNVFKNDIDLSNTLHYFNIKKEKELLLKEFVVAPNQNIIKKRI